jgi:hypothetical protein
MPSAVTLIVTTTGSTVDSTLPVSGQSRYTVDTLPTAVAFANAHPSDTYTVKFASGVAGAINLGTGSGTLVIDANITINGPGSGGITIEGGTVPNSPNNVQVFFIDPGVSVVLKNLTISNGYQPTTETDPGGGGIYNGGTLTLTSDVLSGNSANTGAAIYNAGEAEASRTTFTGGTAFAGAAVFNTGTFVMNSDLLVGNSASASGGAVYNARTGPNGLPTAGTMIIKGSEFLQNTAGADGGAMENDATMTLKNDQFVMNHAMFGGAIFEDSNAHLTLKSVRFIGNVATVAGDNIFVPSP